LSYVELAGSLLAYDDELEPSPEGGSAKSLSTIQLARSPLNLRGGVPRLHAG
jgi:hypothetical protein